MVKTKVISTILMTLLLVTFSAMASTAQTKKGPSNSANGNASGETGHSAYGTGAGA
jgi:hypothetical protein